MKQSTKIKLKAKALEKAEKRWAKFQSCKHRIMQQFTECCSDQCFENIYITKEEMIREAYEKIKEKRRAKKEEENDIGW